MVNLLNPMDDGTVRTIKAQYSQSSPANMNRGGSMGATGVIYIKQATKSGLTPMLVGGVADLNYVNSKTRRGRVIDMGKICPTLTTENLPSVLEKWTWNIGGDTYLIRIRKLTPKEGMLLMGFTVEDYFTAKVGDRETARRIMSEYSDTVEQMEEAEKIKTMSDTQLYSQEGNSIVVTVLERILERIFTKEGNLKWE